MSDTPLVDVLSTHLPDAIGCNLLSQSRPALEAILAFALGAECPRRLAHAHTDWSREQPAALKALHDALHPSHKRARDTDTPDDPAPKRPKPIDDDNDDPPQFTLPSISTTSPVRKKVDVTVHARSIRFLNPSTRALEASLPLASITRAFLLPTRGKSKPHWTVVLLTADTTPGKSKVAPQIIFGLDARTSTAFDTTTYAPVATTTLAKGTDTAPALRTLLVHVPVPLLEPSPAIFRSACASTPTAGIDAYLGAKAGTLWFLDAGILWGESKPCAFWAVGDLLPKDGVRLLSATGRTCSVVLTRARASGHDDRDDGEEEEEEEEETAFSMVDGREQDPIDVWVRHRKHLFGKRTGGTTVGGCGGKTPQAGNATVQGPAWDDSDSDDDDFEASSEDLEGTDEDENGEDGDDHEDSEDEASEQGSDEEEEEELDEARHPLLRPGAVPRMSKAAIDAVVDMVHRDFVDDASEEEDELEE